MEKFETTIARIDERVKNIDDQVNHLQSKLLNGITDRLTLVETKIALLESANSAFGKWADLGFKIASTIVAAVILYKLFGISH